MLGRRQTIKAARRADATGTISLAKLRVWYTQNDGAQAQGGGSSSAATQNTEHMIPKSRFDEVNERAQKAEAALVKLQTDSQAAEKARLEKQGEWQQIAENEKKRATDLEAKAQRADVLEQGYVEQNKLRIERVPEANRSLIPMDYQPERLSAYLTANWDRLVGKPAPDIDAGAGGAGGAGASATMTDDEKRTAKASGMTEAEWVAAKNKAASR